MGVPYQNTDMTKHQQYVVVRNERGQEMMDSIRHRLQTTPTSSQGDRRPIVMQVSLHGTADCNMIYCGTEKGQKDARVCMSERVGLRLLVCLYLCQQLYICKHQGAGRCYGCCVSNHAFQAFLYVLPCCAFAGLLHTSTHHRYLCMLDQAKLGNVSNFLQAGWVP
jgi:hypothetical protein